MSDAEDSDPQPGRVRGLWSSSRALVRVAYRDPDHVPERLTLYAAERLAEPSRAWAEKQLRERPDEPKAKIADDLRSQSANVARVDGIVAGTPFFIALVPGYVAYLWQEGRMALRTAALYGHDPADLRTSAEMLTFRGVHPSPEVAEEALKAVRDAGPPEKVDERRSWRDWYHAGYLLLVFGGFLSAPDDEADRENIKHSRWRAAGGFAVGAAIWATTWLLPLTFMIAMAWGCETHTRKLGRRALAYYDGDAATPEEAIEKADEKEDKGHDKRAILRTVALGLSVAVPVGFVAYANHVRQDTGISWVGALGALVALSLVIATAVVASRK